MTKKYHVCFVSYGVYSYLTSSNVAEAGGAERQQYIIGRELADRGHKVTYLTARQYGVNKQETDRFDIVNCIPKKGGYSGAPNKLVHIFDNLIRIDADVYYCRAETFHYVLTAAFSKLFGKPMVYAVAGDHHVESDKLRQKLGPIYRCFYKLSLQWTDEITTLTEYQKEVLQSEFNRDAKVVPVGYDLPPERDVRSQSKRSNFLWIGRIARDNNPLAFINIAEELDQCSFVMGGPPSEDEFSRTVIKRAKSLDNIEYVGFIKPPDVHQYFRDAKGFIQTTRTNSGFGNTTLEAWRYATPVLSLYSNFDGQIIDRNLGFYSGGSNEKLREGVTILNEDKEYRRKLGWNGRKFLRKNFYIDDVVNMYNSIFSEITTNK